MLKGLEENPIKNGLLLCESHPFLALCVGAGLNGGAIVC